MVSTHHVHWASCSFQFIILLSSAQPLAAHFASLLTPAMISSEDSLTITILQLLLVNELVCCVRIVALRLCLTGGRSVDESLPACTACHVCCQYATHQTAGSVVHTNCLTTTWLKPKFHVNPVSKDCCYEQAKWHAPPPMMAVRCGLVDGSAT